MGAKKPSIEKIIKAHQSRVVEIFRPHVVRDADLVIEPGVSFEKVEYSRLRTNSEVDFSLKNRAVLATAQRRAGDNISVVSLRRHEGIWLSWFELWTIPEQNKITLKGVSLAVWSGFADGAKAELIRAEWDPGPRPHGQNNAQPHWHVDHPVGVVVGSQRSITDELAQDTDSPLVSIDDAVPMVGSMLGESNEISVMNDALLSEVSEGLVSLDGEADTVYEIQGYHLGMCLAWDGGRVSWKGPWDDDRSHLYAWLEATLAYTINQIIEYPAKRFP